MPFCDHRGKFLQVLSEEGWPVAEVDIAALEKEIEKGNKFLQQSRDLRRAAAEACDGDDAASEVSDGGRVHQPMSNAEPTNQVCFLLSVLDCLCAWTFEISLE